jgi:DNA-binding transcriptional regulator GbsR (MarR family)
MAIRNEYTETVRDLQELLKREADQKRREDLGNDLKRMAQDLEKQRENVIDLRVLSERVDNLKTLTWVLIFALAATVFTLVMELVKK